MFPHPINLHNFPISLSCPSHFTTFPAIHQSERGGAVPFRVHFTFCAMDAAQKVKSTRKIGILILFGAWITVRVRPSHRIEPKVNEGSRGVTRAEPSGGGNARGERRTTDTNGLSVSEWWSWAQRKPLINSQIPTLWSDLITLCYYLSNSLLPLINGQLPLASNMTNACPISSPVPHSTYNQWHHLAPMSCQHHFSALQTFYLP